MVNIRRPEMSEEAKANKEYFERLDSFSGMVEQVLIEPDNINTERNQYHLLIRPTQPPELVNMVKDSKTGYMHEWIGITKETDDENVSEGSNLHKYIMEIEMLYPQTKKFNTHQEVLKSLVNKVILFVKKPLGKSFGGHEAKQFWIPYKDISDEFIGRKKK